MTYRTSFPLMISLLLLFLSACAQEETNEQVQQPAVEKEPHRYGGWYCPDNFGFVPVDISQLGEVPVVSNRLPTEEELHGHRSLIKVDTVAYPDARALKMQLPRVARIHSEQSGLDEIIIVIQAIVVEEDTVVGYRFANGGNGSAYLSDVRFVSDKELAEMGPQPFFYRTAVLNGSTEDIWNALTKTDYFARLGKEFGQQAFFSSKWSPSLEMHLKGDTENGKATGYVGLVYGNFYLHIDYLQNGFHYSEKMLLSADHEQNTTELYFASGPFPKNTPKQLADWSRWFEEVKRSSEAR